MRFSKLLLALGPAVIGVIPQGTPAQMQPAARANLVLRLLPADSRRDATILLRDEHGEEVYREGTGTFLCVSDSLPSDRISMVCHHHVLEERLRFERNLRDETGLRGDDFRARLCREVEEAGLGIPPGSMEISASLARDEEGDYAKQMTIYHLLWVPGESTVTLGVQDEDPGDGRPFLHQADTCGAHIMWSETVAVP